MVLINMVFFSGTAKDTEKQWREANLRKNQYHNTERFLSVSLVLA